MVVGGSRSGIRDTPWGLFSDPKPRDLYHKFLLLKGVPNTKNSCKVRGVNRTDSRNIRKVGLFCKFEQFRFFILVSTPKDKPPREVERLPRLVFSASYFDEDRRQKIPQC